ncbi:hypothetical protein Bbelb_018950 [Branchiostoma belcheri]|nr:hypothetical protein Bbelb_018950 [Branchiostoma belcheri]
MWVGLRERASHYMKIAQVMQPGEPWEEAAGDRVRQEDIITVQSDKMYSRLESSRAKEDQVEYLSFVGCGMKAIAARILEHDENRTTRHRKLNEIRFIRETAIRVAKYAHRCVDSLETHYEDESANRTVWTVAKAISYFAKKLYDEKGAGYGVQTDREKAQLKRKPTNKHYKDKYKGLTAKERQTGQQEHRYQVLLKRPNGTGMDGIEEVNDDDIFEMTEKGRQHPAFCGIGTVLKMVNPSVRPHSTYDCEESVAFHVDSLQQFLRTTCPNTAVSVRTVIRKHGECRSFKTTFAKDDHSSRQQTAASNNSTATHFPYRQYAAGKVMVDGLPDNVSISHLASLGRKSLQSILESFNIDTSWETAAQTRAAWRSHINKGATLYEQTRTAEAMRKRTDTEGKAIYKITSPLCAFSWVVSDITIPGHHRVQTDTQHHGWALLVLATNRDTRPYLGVFLKMTRGLPTVVNMMYSFKLRCAPRDVFKSAHTIVQETLLGNVDETALNPGLPKISNPIYDFVQYMTLVGFLPEGAVPTTNVQQMALVQAEEDEDPRPREGNTEVSGSFRQLQLTREQTMQLEDFHIKHTAK